MKRVTALSSQTKAQVSVAGIGTDSLAATRRSPARVTIRVAVTELRPLRVQIACSNGQVSRNNYLHDTCRPDWEICPRAGAGARVALAPVVFQIELIGTEGPFRRYRAFRRAVNARVAAVRTAGIPSIARIRSPRTTDARVGPAVVGFACDQPVAEASMRAKGEQQRRRDKTYLPQDPGPTLDS
jgi:hypothetical protein